MPNMEQNLNTRNANSGGSSRAFFSLYTFIMAGQPSPPRNKGLIAGLIKGNQWSYIPSRAEVDTPPPSEGDGKSSTLLSAGDKDGICISRRVG